MAITKQDQLSTSIDLVFLGLIFILLIFLLGWMHHYRQQQARALALQMRNLALSKHDLSHIKNELTVLAEYAAQYAVLLDQAKHHEGLLNSNNNQDWLRQLQAQQKKLRLFNIAYRLDLREQAKPAFISAYTNLPIKLTAITLEFDLLHEEDLLQLSDALTGKQFTGIIWRDCQITRVHAGPWPSDAVQANLHSNCHLDSYSMDKPMARKGMQP